jgi:hypothetical protein
MFFAWCQKSISYGKVTFVILLLSAETPESKPDVDRRRPSWPPERFENAPETNLICPDG